MSKVTLKNIKKEKSNWLPVKRQGENSLSLSQAMNEASETTSIAVYSAMSNSGKAALWTMGAITGKNRLKKAFEAHSNSYRKSYASTFNGVRAFPGTMTGIISGVAELINAGEGSVGWTSGTVFGIWALANLLYLQTHSFYQTGKILKPIKQNKRLP